MTTIEEPKTKKRWARAEVLSVVRELCAVLGPVTERLIVAGSLRRCRADVGDIELLFIPKIEVRQLDLLESGPFNVTEEAIAGLLASGVLGKRESRTGSFAWGQLNKLAVHLASGVPVDLFTATAANWWNYLVCRTGPAESNTRIASEAQAKGWKWNPYGAGFTRGGALAGEKAEHEVASEREVFEFVGLEYREPRERP